MVHIGRVLTAVACGTCPAAAIGTCVKLARDRGWTVQVIATPAALDFFDAAAIADQAGSPVRSQHARPGAPRSPIPNAVLVAPATYNTICNEHPGQDDLPVTNQHFGVEVSDFLIRCSSLLYRLPASSSSTRCK